MNIERARVIRNLLQGIYEDRVIKDSEDNLKATPNVYDVVPDPNTCHPALSHAADYVRFAQKEVVQIVRVDPRTTTLFVDQEAPPESLLTKNVTLTGVRAWALAPFVGDPRTERAIYIWPVWFDDYKRHICGDSTLVWDREI